jgi:S1-C subfamily serine protease
MAAPRGDAEVVKVHVTTCAGTQVGTGVMLSQGVLTARHVVEGAVAVSIETIDGKVKPLQVELSPELDLALVRIPSTGEADPAALDLHPDAAATVTVSGFPLGHRYRSRSAQFLEPLAGHSPVDPRIAQQLDIVVRPGESGSPVRDGDGAVVGMVYAARRETGAGLVISSRDIDLALDSLVPANQIACS